MSQLRAIRDTRYACKLALRRTSSCWCDGKRVHEASPPAPLQPSEPDQGSGCWGTGWAERLWQIFREEQDAALVTGGALQLRLSCHAVVSARGWVGAALATPTFSVTGSESLQDGIRAWNRLRTAIDGAGVAAGMPGHVPSRAASGAQGGGRDWAWQQLREAYFDVWAGAGRCTKRVEARLRAMDTRFAAKRKRVDERLCEPRASSDYRKPCSSSSGPPTYDVSSTTSLPHFEAPWSAKREFRGSLADLPKRRKVRFGSAARDVGVTKAKVPCGKPPRLALVAVAATVAVAVAAVASSDLVSGRRIGMRNMLLKEVGAWSFVHCKSALRAQQRLLCLLSAWAPELLRLDLKHLSRTQVAQL